MWLHFLLFSALLLIPVVFPPRRCRRRGRKSRKQQYLFSVFVLLFIIAAFRAYDIGNDTSEYLRIFSLACDSSSFSELYSGARYEPGYLMLVYIISRVTDNFTVLLCVATFFYLFSVFRFINKYSRNISLSVLLFFSFSMFYDVMVTQRQCLSIAIFLFAIDFLIERKAVKFFVFALAAATFHTMSLLLLPLYFLPEADLSKTGNLLKWSIIIFAGLLAYGVLSEVFLNFFPYYRHYLDSIYSLGGIRLASVAFVAVRLTCVFVLWLAGTLKTLFKSRPALRRKRRPRADCALKIPDRSRAALPIKNRGLKVGAHAAYIRKIKYRSKVNNIFMQLMLADCVCALYSIPFNLFDRVEGFFTMGFILLCTNALSVIINREERVFCKIIIVIVPFVYTTAMLIGRSNWYGIFPYRFCF